MCRLTPQTHDIRISGLESGIVVFQVPHVRPECSPGGAGSLLKVNLGEIGMLVNGHKIKLWEHTMGGNAPVQPGNMRPF